MNFAAWQEYIYSCHAFLRELFRFEGKVIAVSLRLIQEQGPKIG
jgi:hypothetical protein